MLQCNNILSKQPTGNTAPPHPGFLLVLYCKPMNTDTFSVRLDRSTKTRLEKLAKSTGRSRSFLAAEALSAYLDVNEWQVAGVKRAMAGEYSRELSANVFAGQCRLHKGLGQTALGQIVRRGHQAVLRRRAQHLGQQPFAVQVDARRVAARSAMPK